MASSFEKSVKGGTKIKLAPPKSKYVEHILIATHAGEAGVAEIFRALQNRLRDSTWTVVFKALIIVHLMIREGEPEVTLKFLSHSPKHKLAINHFTEGNLIDVVLTKHGLPVQTQGRNIRTYSEYLLERARSYAGTKIDYVRSGEGRLKKLSIDKGLLRETESVQNQIAALVRCEMFQDEPENEITLTAFRLLTMDLLALFHVMNEGTINVLEHYFEMSHPDAERALNIYRTFCRQTEMVVQYLSVARLHEHSTRLEIPKIKHAPTSLAKSLEEYLNDKDFEINRRQYLAQQEAKKNVKGTNGTSNFSPLSRAKEEPKPISAPARADAQKGPAPDLIDFFESIEQNQQPLGQSQAAPQFQPQTQFPQSTGFPMQQTGFQPQPTGMPMQQPFVTGASQSMNPFGQPQQPQQQLQPNFTGAGFGGYTPQPFNPQPTLASIPQDSVANFQQQQQQPFGQQPTGLLQPQNTSTNPFRQSMVVNTNTGASNSSVTSPLGPSPSTSRSTNPFAKPQQSPSPFGGLPSINESQSTPFAQPQQQPLQPAPTGTNPFARSHSPLTQQTPSPQPGGLMPNPTGSTNPFRQSAFVNQQTGQGWQTGQGTMGGLEQLDTVAVFPRPGQPTGQQQGGWP